MAKTGTSSRFVSMNLSKSYGPLPSPPTGHGSSSVPSATGSSSSAQRGRVQRSHSGMVALPRAGRSQPSASSSSGSRASKLAIPRPVNLPSLRREHAGNDPAVPLAGMPGSTGWSKQQVLPSAIDGSAASQSARPDSTAVGSSGYAAESRWRSPVPERTAISVSQEDKMEQRKSVPLSDQTPSGRSPMYIPPSSRNSDSVDLHHMQCAPSAGAKAMVVRGEDFPTLQAAVQPLSVPPSQRLRGMQQKQREKQQELREQHVKLQELSQQNRKVNMSYQSMHHTSLPLHSSLPQHALPKQASISEGLRHSAHRMPEAVPKAFKGPLPLIRLTRTSNWDDDERETLHRAHGQVVMQSDCMETSLSQKGYKVHLDHKVEINTGWPASHKDSTFSFGKEHSDLQDHKRNGGSISEGQSMRDLRVSSDVFKGLSNQQVEVGPWEDMASWRRAPKSYPPKQEWIFPPKEVISNRDGRADKTNGLSNTKNLGPNMKMPSNAGRTVDHSHRGDGADRFTVDGHLRDGRNRLNVNFSNHRLDDGQVDRSRKNVNGYQYGRPDISNTARVHAGAKNNLRGFDYGRDVYIQESSANGSKSFKSSQSIAFESFVGFSGFEAKITRRKGKELLSFHDPARERFEAELEKVQKMQEQERRRLAEERERAIELARKEEEERLRAAREEELLRLKLEEETRKAAAQAQRDQEEAVRKTEEMRQAREEHKRMIVLEEERRKEAARKKLLELEQRMALREFGRTLNAGCLERRSLKDAMMRDDFRGLQIHNNMDMSHDHASNKVAMTVQTPMRKELTDCFRPNPLVMNSMRRLSELKGGEVFPEDRTKVIQRKRPETLDDEPVRHYTIENYGYRDMSSGKLDNRSFPLQEMSVRPIRSFAAREPQSSSAVHLQQRVLLDSFVRKEHLPPAHGDHLSTPLASVSRKGYMDSGIERDSDGWWVIDNRGKSQQGQRLNSPPLNLHANWGENDYQSFSRVRQSLPRQPKVPPPVFGRASSQKQITQSKSVQGVPPHHHRGGPANANKDEFDNINQKSSVERKTETRNHAQLPTVEVSSVETLPNDVILAQCHHTSKLFDDAATVLEDLSQVCKDAISEPDEIDQFSEQLSDLTESEEQSKDDAKQAIVSMEASEAFLSVDDEDDGLVAEGSMGNIGEELCSEVEQIIVAAQLDLNEQEWDSAKAHEGPKSLLEHVNEKEMDISAWESQHMDGEENGDVDELQRPTDSQWMRDQSVVLMTGNQDEKHSSKEVEISSAQDAVKSAPMELPNSPLAPNLSDYVRDGPSESHISVQSFIQQFQQPFSFMAVPLPQSTTMNGVQLHPPMLPSMHNLSAQQDIPYPLQTGLFSNAPLIPNAIQIGSIQMPLQVHPQISSVAQHHQQPPVFQFGQICQFSQPVPPMQSAFQMHHVLGQPLLSQNQQTNFASSQETLKLSTICDGVKESEDLARPSSRSIAPVNGPVNSLLDDSRILKDSVDQNSNAGFSNSAHTILPLLELGPNNTPTQGEHLTDNTLQDNSAKITCGSTKWTNDVWNHAVYANGGGNMDGQCIAAQASTEISGKGAPLCGANWQKHYPVEHKIHKPQLIFEKTKLVPNQEIHDMESNDQASGPAIVEGARADASDSRFCAQSFSGTKSQVGGAVPSLGELQTGFRIKQGDAGQAWTGRASKLTKSTLSKVESAEFVDTSLPYSVDFGLEEEGSEFNKAKDGFGEFGSKCQLLGEQSEMQDKALTNGLKVKEQTTDNQKKVLGKCFVQEEASLLSAGNCSPAGTQSALNVDFVNNDERHGKHQMSAVGSNLQQFGAPSNLMGFATAAVTEPMVLKSLKSQRVAVAATTDTQGFGPRYSNTNTASINAAWDAQHVDSSTKIQLEEARRLVVCDEPMPQFVPMSTRSASSLGTENLRPQGSLGNISSSAKTSVSVPSPISSLLAGEKIEFGAVTSPTVTSCSTRPPSPFIGTIGAQFGIDKTNFPLQPSCLARSYARQDSTDTILFSNITTEMEDDMNEQLVDAEAEAMAAASAVAAAAISNDEAVNSFDATNAGLDGAGAGIERKRSGVDNAIVAALPVDLSVETTASLAQIPLANCSAPSEIMLQNLPSIGTSFSGLEMGTITGGPIFAYGSPADAAVPLFEPGVACLGAGNVGGWQHGLSNTSDSYYGAPAPFMSSTGLPSIQGPHMLVYTSPFTQVGQFGQPGMSFMGATYHPSGKQPDWTHIPYATSPASLSQRGGDMISGQPHMSDAQHTILPSNSSQAISGAGCSVMPVPAPMSAPDTNFGSPFQAQWTRTPSPGFSN